MIDMRYLFLLLLCAACTTSRSTFQKQGGKCSIKLATTLAQVETKNDLSERSTEIKKQFNKLAALAIAADKYAKKHPHEPLYDFPTTASDMLQYEMMPRLMDAPSYSKNYKTPLSTNSLKFELRIDFFKCVAVGGEVGKVSELTHMQWNSRYISIA